MGSARMASETSRHYVAHLRRRADGPIDWCNSDLIKRRLTRPNLLDGWRDRKAYRLLSFNCHVVKDGGTGHSRIVRSHGESKKLRYNGQADGLRTVERRENQPIWR